jgi:hypothetical protein
MGPSPDFYCATCDIYDHDAHEPLNCVAQHQKWLAEAEGRIDAAVKAAVADEREACAKIAEAVAAPWDQIAERFEWEHEEARSSRKAARQCLNVATRIRRRAGEESNR